METQTQQAGTQPTPQAPGTQPAQPTTIEFDYEKLARIVNGKQTVTEDTVLKNYFKQQGLSGEEMAQAISSFKQQKAASTPDVTKMQTELSQAQATVLQATLEREATYEAIALGLDVKTIPYVLKLADISNVMDGGKVNNEKLKEAINKVLEDIPQMKPSQQQATGFRVGADPDNMVLSTKATNQVTNQKRWNRFN